MGLLERMQQFTPGSPREEPPRTQYQRLGGRTFSITRGPHQEVSRGELTVDQSSSLLGDDPRDGWYDASGEYVGEELN